MPPDSPDETAYPQGQWFATTHWSMVQAAGRATSTQAQAALEQLCQTYWPPLYAYVRRRGHGPEDAKDLTQEFFLRFLDKQYFKRADQRRGKFRTFLLTSLKHFLVNEWEKGQAAKRGGGGKVESWDLLNEEQRYAGEASHDLNPETVFEKRWAETLLEQARHRLRQEYGSFGKLELFERLKGLLDETPDSAAYSELARSLGMSDGTLKVAVHRLRHRYHEMLCAEVAHTVDSPAEVESELRHLLHVLRRE